MKMNPTLSIETKNAIDQAISAASQQFGEMLRSLAHDLATERRKARQLAQQLAKLQSQLHAKSTPTPQTKTEPKLPAGFRYSTETSLKRHQLTTELLALQKEEARELSRYEQQTLDRIAARTQKEARDAAYRQALKSDFSTATAAIVARKRDIETNGQTITTDYTGNTTKCEIDLNTMSLFTFTRLTQPDFEFQGKMYQLTSADCSEIGAGNRYTFIKSN